MNQFIPYLLKVYKEMTRKEVSILPSYISFYILLSFVPLLSLILISLSLIYNDNQDFILLLAEVFPVNVYTFITQFVNRYQLNYSIFTINNIILLYLSSRIYFSIYHGNTIIFKSKIKRNVIFDKLLAFVNTLIILVIIVTLAIIIVLSTYFNKFLEVCVTGVPCINEFIRILLIFGVLFTLVSFMMFSLPRYKYNIKRIIKGSITSTILIMLSSYIFRIYVDIYSNYDNIYYTFSTFIVFILWIYIISYAILIGLVVNYIEDKN